MSVKIRIRILLDKNGMCDKGLAEYLGLSTTQLSNRMNGRVEWQHKEIEKVLDLGATYEEIFRMGGV